MAAKNHSVGIDHVTVVPKPAAPAVDDETGEGEAEETDADTADTDEANVDDTDDEE